MTGPLKPTLTEKLENIPTSPGVYKYFDDTGKVIYIGKAKNLKNRVKSYFQQNRPRDAKTISLISNIEDVEFIRTDSEMEALILENNLVKEFKPRYNINLKDDKTFPYIVVTKEEFPRVYTTRRMIRNGSLYFGPYTNVGNMKQALKMIKDLFMVRSCQLPLTEGSVRQGKWKVCLDYHIKKCLGPCEGHQSRTDYNTMIRQVVELINGKTTTLKKIVREEMEMRSENLDFENAAILRDRLAALEVYEGRQKIVNDDFGDRDVFGFAFGQEEASCAVLQVREGKMVGSQHFYLEKFSQDLMADEIESFLYKYYQNNAFIPSEIVLKELLEASFESLETVLKPVAGKKVQVVHPKIGDKQRLLEMAEKNAGHLLSDLLLQKQKKVEDFVPGSVKALQRDLRLPSLPRRIECFDNSNIQGTDPVSSMVCFFDGKPRKSDYRKFKVKTVEGPDDFATMMEIMERRYNGSLSEELPLPDLIVIDGGKGQLSHAADVLKQTKAAGIPVIGLAKKLEEVFFPGDKDPYNLPKTSSGLKLLQQARDEAHRFAITFHRELRDKRTLQTELTQVPTIGPGKAKKLLVELGSVEGVRQADQSTLSGLVGEKSASELIQWFSKQTVME